jgi:large subunit ribosomal protein L18
MKTAEQLKKIRKSRQRYKIASVSKGKHRLVIHRSNNHIYAQILAKDGTTTVAQASTISKEFKETKQHGSNKAAAAAIGKMIALKAAEKQITEVVFDRSGFLYHGKVKVLAESARENGLKF